jgi:hypothetical protein
MDLDGVIGKHADWKIKFRRAISRHKQMDVATIANDRCCELGKWLHGDAKSNFGGLQSHAACVKTHADFHEEAAKVASAINAGDFTEAEAMLAGRTPYAHASSALYAAIVRLRDEASGL